MNPPIVRTAIEIAQAAKLRPITDVASDLGLGADDIETYGKSKAKVRLEVLQRAKPRGRLVLVTGINPTSAGEGKTTVTVGLTQALRRLGTNAVLCIRQPSLGPVFGMKGGAAGGGWSQVLPMQDINLHFTGDFHAITAANNLLAAMVDNHIHQGNALGLDPRRVAWRRAIDMNDRALREIVVGLGGAGNGVPREDGFLITAASEVMAIVALAADLPDLERRCGEVLVGLTYDRKPVRARDLQAPGAMTLLLADAIKPNLVQTLEGGPAFVHCGPYGNIAHGCNSILATRMALALSDLVVTEAGFGSDLGAEKFFDIKCRFAGLEPEAAVLVASVRALKLQGGASRAALGREDLGALAAGLPNLDKHIENLALFGVPAVVAVNRFATDTPAELDAVVRHCERQDVPAAVAEVFDRGGAGGEELGRVLLQTLATRKADFRLLYETDRPIAEKIQTIARTMYGADGVDYLPPAQKAIDELEAMGLGRTPVCMAKTQYSLTDDPAKLGRPRGFRITVRNVTASAGAGFVVALAGEIMTMPGLAKVPAANAMRVHPDGRIEGLF
jgi:formate--tetrahydrofolate ligase